jgi:hypothetical protein
MAAYYAPRNEHLQITIMERGNTSKLAKSILNRTPK